MSHSPAPSDASHDSGDENNESTSNNKTPASKDKECQYCHQKFTSSSLGRHLDQFISKKKPDGIHSVDEIRRLRGGITRRTARNSQKKDVEESRSSQHSPSPQYTLPSYSELLTKTAPPVAPPVAPDWRLNKLNWQATGVITDTTTSSLNPPAATVAASPSTSNQHVNQPITGQKRTFSTYASDLPSPAVNNEATRALELSLREVLDAVRVATKRAAPQPRPFTFDFESQTFPFLVLTLLPTPATLFSPTPFATSSTISLAPPGLDQYQTLRSKVSGRIDYWKWKALSHVQKTNGSARSNTFNISEEADSITESAKSYLNSCLNHLDDAFQSFQSYPPETQHQLWIIELLRALKIEKDQVTDTKGQLDRTTQERNQLEQQVDHLSRCQWPREMALWPPDRIVFDSKTRDELSQTNLSRGSVMMGNVSNGTTSLNTGDHNSGIVEDYNIGSGNDNNDLWDYERLVSKWKKHVREDQGRRTRAPPPLTPSAMNSSSGSNNNNNNVNSVHLPQHQQSYISSGGQSAPVGNNSHPPATEGPSNIAHNHNHNHVSTPETSTTVSTPRHGPAFPPNPTATTSGKSYSISDHVNNASGGAYNSNIHRQTGSMSANGSPGVAHSTGTPTTTNINGGTSGNSASEGGGHNTPGPTMGLDSKKRNIKITSDLEDNFGHRFWNFGADKTPR